ncbi:MAG: AMP-binding protein [Rhodomicrobium sp.]
MLPSGATYEEIQERFVWQVPEFYNIGADVCDRWARAEPERTALIAISEAGLAETVTFGALRDRSNATANLLETHGIGQGDRVGVLLPQSAETAYCHIAAFKMGAISIPLFTLFGEEALEHRLRDAGAKAVITNAEGAAKLAAIRERLPALDHVFCVSGQAPGALDFHAGAAKQSTAYEPKKTRADDPALIIYTSGTTGLPKGALHAHRVLLGHLPGIEMAFDLFPQEGDRIWTPADWAWIGGLLDVLLPALHHGVPVVSRRFAKFTGEAAFDLIEKHGVRNAFIPPTALKTMRAVPDAEKRWRLNMRSVGSGGESLGAGLLDWGRRVLGVTINEFYGQTECNMVVSSAASVMNPRPGCMGRAVPGHHVEVIGADGKPCADGVAGDIAVKAPDPVMFLGYWNNAAATAAKYRGHWLITGDQGIRREGGYLQFAGRDDDVINSAGYRIGPGEIEDCLLRHEAVQAAAVIGKPDAARTEIVKAYVVLREGVAATGELKAGLQNFVKTRLAAHEYPREIEFVASLPMTVTGKIIRKELRERARVEGSRNG